MGLPGAQQRAEVEKHKLEALQYKQKHKIKYAPPLTSRCSQIGCVYGVGIGLYFQILSWLRLLLFWLALASVPYLIVINTSQFTTAEHKGQLDGVGVTVLPVFNPLQSFTFAAVMDDTRDAGVLAWMNVRLPGFEGTFALSRKIFLEWIALVDAGSMAVFSIACMLLYKAASRFAKEVDDSTMEVSDYTVIVKGLPETTPIDIGHHFSRFGRVMDVVLCKDFGPLLQLAATATNLEQRRRAAEGRLEQGHNAVAFQRQVASTEKKMAEFMQEANKQLDSSGFQLKAAFVTFNRQGDRAACQAACPKRWLSSWFHPKADKFLGKYRFWVEQAKPPEDYIYENLHFSRGARYLRMALVRLAVLVVLLISAAAVTKLMAINISAARNLVWQTDAMNESISAAMQAVPLTTDQLHASPGILNATLTQISASVGLDAAETLQQTPDAVQRIRYCSVQLLQMCSTAFSNILGTNLTMQPAQAIAWAQPADAFLKAPDLMRKLQDCSRTPGCALAMCYPCYCRLLSEVAQGKVTDSDFVYNTKQECSTFITAASTKTMLIKGLISMVIVVLNITLKFILQLLVRFEKHWTQSAQEHAYAVLAFVSQLLNSVLVLLLVNARSGVASSAINARLGSSQTTSWGANLILSGPYSDFSTAWYTDVGQSLQLLIILNAVLTAGFAWGLWLHRKLRQSCLMTCVVTASQAMYNSAWLGMDFVLDYRVSDMMLGLWIILMFGSGLPGLYIWGIVWLVVVDVTDRWYLARMCQQPVRYGKQLPYLLLGVLPWAAATHCSFGLWMHTHFYAGSQDGQLSFLTSGNMGSPTSIEQLKNTYVWLRITQPNGLPLLILLLVHLTIHVFIRLLIYFASGKACKSCSEDQGDAPEIEVTYESALLSSNNKSGRSMLAGTATYRMPHHPRYADLFQNAMYQPIWFRAFGRLRYTQLVSRPGGGFHIAPEVVLHHDQSDMDETIASMPGELQAAAHRLAEGLPENASKPRKSVRPRSSLDPSLLTTPRERSQSVNVAVLAGLSQTGEAPSPRAHSVSCVAVGLSPRLGSTGAPGSPQSFTSQHDLGGSFVYPGSLTPQGTSFSGGFSPIAAAAGAGYPSMMPAAGFDASSVLPSLVADPRMSAVLGPLYGDASDGAGGGGFSAPYAAQDWSNVRHAAEISGVELGLAASVLLQEPQSQQQPPAAYPAINGHELAQVAPSAWPFSTDAAAAAVQAALQEATLPQLVELERAGWDQQAAPAADSSVQTHNMDQAQQRWFMLSGQQHVQPSIWDAAMAAACAPAPQSMLTPYAISHQEQQQQAPCHFALIADKAAPFGSTSQLFGPPESVGYPNVHLTTVEMPAMYAAGPAPSTQSLPVAAVSVAAAAEAVPSESAFSGAWQAAASGAVAADNHHGHPNGHSSTCSAASVDPAGMQPGDVCEADNSHTCTASEASGLAGDKPGVRLAPLPRGASQQDHGDSSSTAAVAVVADTAGTESQVSHTAVAVAADTAGTESQVECRHRDSCSDEEPHQQNGSTAGSGAGGMPCDELLHVAAGSVPGSSGGSKKRKKHRKAKKGRK